VTPFYASLFYGLSQHLRAETPGEDAPQAQSPPGFRRAAVLVPLVTDDHLETISVPLMTRTDRGGPHSGQISFPGGRVEPHDKNPIDTALRETGEEFGLSGDHVSVLGQLSFELTPTGYLVTPVIGWIKGPIQLTPDPAEVAQIFWVPLAFFLDPANETVHAPVHFRGRCFRLYEYHYKGHKIWGLTARIIHRTAAMINNLNLRNIRQPHDSAPSSSQIMDAEENEHVRVGKNSKMS
jgi:8-oxo-dGTP pyrophosphatase MutT (NUDIX family)